MAYTKSNELQTRIALKYDSYLNWTTNNPVLLAGEIAIATVPAAAEGNNSASTGFTNLPNVVMKVGDGSSHYNDLKFVSALSADVYDWAKAAQKPSYDASEIANLQKFVEDHSDFDTNTEYSIVPVENAAYKYELKYKNIGDAEFKSYDTPVYIDLSDADTRLKKVEADVAALIGGEGETGGITDMINDAIDALDSEKTQTAGADGLALHIKQENGVITEFSGSIAAETYDAHGAAAAAETAAKGYADGLIAQEVIDRDAAIAVETKAREEAIKALDYTAYVPGNADGTVVSFVGTVSQADGVISAEKRDLVFNSAYHAETNKAATMADVTNAVADLNGAMHFEGVSTTDPVNVGVTIEGKADYVAAAGDVVIYNTIEYVYDGSKWVQLGDESLAGTLIAALDLPRVNVGAAKTLSYIEQTDGTVAAEAVDIQIAQSQVTGLEDRLDAIEDSLGTDGDLPKQVEANKQAIATINGEDAGKSMRAVATEEAAAAVGALDLNDAAVEGKYVAAVKQTDGQIEVVRADLPTIPVLELVEGTVAAATEGEVTVIADIDVDGHKITDKRVNVVTKDFVNTAFGNLDATKDVTTTKHVMTGLVQEDGLVTSIKEVELADVAFSGNIADLKETENTYVVFNCGSSSVNV
jgi:hypothetical protein